jgi:hypothetical protein
MSAVGTQIDRGSATIAQTSSMTAEGRYTIAASSTIPAFSDMSAIGTQIDRGASTISQTSGFSSGGGLKWEVIQNPDTTWTQLTKEQAA